MTRIGRRLIEDFLLPALNDQRYGDLLKWIDRDKRYFCIRWSHKNAAKWTLADTAVFQDWDRLKGHYHPEIKGYYMQAKQRFRAALYKLNSVRKLPCDDKHVKKYQLIIDHDKRRGDYVSRPKVRIAKKEENQKSIPTSVIRKNTSYIEKPSKTEYLEPPMSPPSPVSSVKSDVSDDKEELERCLYEYTMAQQKQMMLGNRREEDGSLTKESSILRENGNGPRMSHVPIQPAPVYSSMLRQIMMQQDISSARFESPRVLLVKTYNDDEEIAAEIKEEPIDYCEVECLLAEQTSDGALNLSVKSEDSETLSR